MNNYRVAKLINNQFVIDDIRVFYQNTSFPAEGLTKEILDAHGVYEVVETLPCLNIEKQIYISPTLKGDKVYTVEVVRKSQSEIDEEKFAEVREVRNGLLNVSDLYVMADRWDDYTESKKNEWKTYRQSLRDLPQTYSSNIHSVVYPPKPS